MDKINKILYKVFKVLGIAFLALFLLIVLALLFIRSPWGQDIIVEKAVAYVSTKTNTKVELEKLYVTFSGNLYLKGLYLEDQQGDTLVFSNKLETGVEILPLLKEGDIHLSKLSWDGLKAAVRRDEQSQDFNFDFLLDAFSSPDTVSAKAEEKPDVNEGFPDIEIGPIELRNFDLVYQDGVMGIDSHLKLGELMVKVEKLDLNKMNFYISDFQFRDTEAYYRQSKPFAPTEEEEVDAPMPLVILDHFQIENVKAFYESLPDQIKADVILGDFLVELPEANLESQKIDLRTIELKDSKIAVKLPAVGNEPSSEEAVSSDTSSGFQWPEWIVDVNSIALENNEMSMIMGDESVREGRFNPSAVQLTDFNLGASQVYLNQAGAGIALNRLDFKEKSGFDLKAFAFQLGIAENSMDLEDLELSLGHSQVMADLKLSYSSIQELIEYPDHSGFSVSLSRFDIDVNELLPLLPELRGDPYVMALSKKHVFGNIEAAGSLSEFELTDAKVNWGDKTRFSTKGKVIQPLDEEHLYLDLSELNFATVRRDIRQFANEQAYGVKFPENLTLESQIKGSLQDMVAEARISMPEGKIRLKGKYLDAETMAFDAMLEGEKLLLEKLLPGRGLGTLTFDISATGKGESLEELNGKLSSNFSELNYKGYDFSGLALRGNMENGQGKVELAFSDENLDMDLSVGLHLDSADSRYLAELDLRGANLRALGLHEKDIRAKLNLKADFEGTPEAFDLSTTLTNGLVVYEDRSYPLGNFDLQAMVRPDSTSMDIRSLMLNGYLRSNASPEEITVSMKEHFTRYFNESLEADSTMVDSAKESAINLDLNLAFKRAPVLDQVFLEGLEKLDSIGVAINFNEHKEQVAAKVTLPYMEYNSITLDSLEVNVTGDGREMLLGLGIAGLDAEPVAMGRTKLTAELRENMLDMDFQSFDGEELMYAIKSTLRNRGDTLDFHVLPEGLIVNKKEWTAPSVNKLSFARRSLTFDDFSFTQNGQKITFSNSLNEEDEEQVGVSFEGFQLASVMSLLNPDTLLLEGRMQGDFIIENPFGAMGLVADLEVKEMKALGAELGNLAINAKSKGRAAYDFDLALKDKGIDLNLNGDYVAEEAGTNLDLKLALNQFELKVLEKLIPDQLSDAKGSLQGNLTVKGSTASPKYQGEFRFEDAAVNITTLNAVYNLPVQPLRVDEQGVYFDQATFKDAQGNNFILDGKIDTEDFTNIGFDLNLAAEKFQLLDSDSEDNELFYGKANLNADVQITGNMNLPKVVARLKVNEGTDLTFVIPEEELEVVEREGVVLIVDRDNPNDILTKTAQEHVSSPFTGVDVQAVLQIDPEAIFRVVIDERSGDNLMIAGEADLNLSVFPNGQMNLSGVYELEKGHYEMSLYNLVSRKFDILKGSSITWKGDPMDADLNITASYEVKTDASDLMATQISGLSADVANQYSQRLPFMVYLNVKGELLRPQIFFQLDMPEDSQGVLGGNVYSRIQQVNGEEGELNRQVFSLLVMQKFLPTTGGNGAAGGTAGMARSSVSQMLSSQLNALSSNVLGNSGFELDFDLDSYSDGQGDRTQLNVSAKKRLFNDRLIVQVGSQMDLEGASQNSQSNNAVFGNVNIEYLLTESGRYRIRGFRRNQFESVIDGQLIVTGIAFILNREFNKFHEFWKGEKIEQEKSEATEEKETLSNEKKEENQ
ncbi:translocation/assembly module TamB domain-containing protein [Echinicola sediminis]